MFSGLKPFPLFAALLMAACTHAPPQAMDEESQRVRSACLKLFGGSPGPLYRGVLQSTGESDGRTVVFNLTSDGTTNRDHRTKRPHCAVRYGWDLDPPIPGLGARDWDARFNGERLMVDGEYAPGGLFTAVTPRADGTLYFERHVMVDGFRIDSSARLTRVR